MLKRTLLLAVVLSLPPCFVRPSAVAGVARPSAGSVIRSFTIPSDDALAAVRPDAPLELPTTQPLTPEDLRAHVAKMNRRFKPIDYDPDSRATELADGVEPALAFVRDEIAFEAYPGVLRGARGTYQSRAGNAADRALLLAQLLNVKGVRTRFAWGRLAPDRAEALYDRMFELPAQGAVAQDGANPATAATAGRGADFVRRLRARAARDYAAVRAALGDRPVPARAAVPKGEVLAEITSHVWVQAQVDGAWTDLDPSFPDAVPGKRYAEPRGTGASIPREQHQMVTVRVVVERLDRGALRRETVLDVKRPAVELVDRQVFLVHAPRRVATGVARAMRGGGNDVWVPMLWVDGEFTAGKPVAFADEAGAPEAKRGGGFGGLFDSLPDGEPKEDEAPAAATRAIVAEVLEFEVALPGGRKQTTRRALADRAGAAWRAADTLNAADLPPLPRNDQGPEHVHTIHNVWLSAGRHDMAAYADAMRLLAETTTGGTGDGATTATASAPAPEEADPAAAFARQVWPVALQNLACVVWGPHVFLPALNDDPTVARFYFDSPRILLFSVGAVPEGEGVALTSVTDLRRDVVRGVAREDGASAATAHRKLWYGVLEGALEHELCAEHRAAATGDGAGVISTSALLDARGAVALSPDAAGAQVPASTPPDVTSRIAARLSAGEVLVVPRAALDAARNGGEDGTGWWAIEADTGDVRAVAGDDLHAGQWRSQGYGPGVRNVRGSSFGRSWSVQPPRTPGAGGRYAPRRPSVPRGGGGGGGVVDYLTGVLNVSIFSFEMSVPVSALIGTGVAAGTAVVVYAVAF